MGKATERVKRLQLLARRCPLRFDPEPPNGFSGGFWKVGLMNLRVKGSTKAMKSSSLLTRKRRYLRLRSKGHEEASENEACHKCQR
jgi:hypothetical protein